MTHEGPTVTEFVGVSTRSRTAHPAGDTDTDTDLMIAKDAGKPSLRYNRLRMGTLGRLLVTVLTPGRGRGERDDVDVSADLNAAPLVNGLTGQAGPVTTSQEIGPGNLFVPDQIELDHRNCDFCESGQAHMNQSHHSNLTAAKGRNRPCEPPPIWMTPSRLAPWHRSKSRLRSLSHPTADTERVDGLAQQSSPSSCIPGPATTQRLPGFSDA
jgi:hypothetical protein